MGGGRSAARGGVSSRDLVLGMPSERSREALTDVASGLLADQLLDDRDAHQPLDEHGFQEGPDRGVDLLGQVVDVFVGSRRLAGWALWLQLAVLAQLVSRWQSAPPLVDDDFGSGGDATSTASAPSAPLIARLRRVLLDLDVWGTIDTRDLAEEFVAAEISAASGLSHYGAAQAVDAARVLFMTERLPRTRQLLRAGLLDWTKLRTVLTGTQTLDDEVCRLVEAHVIPDADLAVADPLDALADPARPGRDLPAVARLTNPALQAALAEAAAAIDAAAATRRAAKARRERRVSATPLPDTMGRLEITTGQEDIAAVLAGLDSAVAAAKRGGDSRTADQIRADHAVHLLSGGAHGYDAYQRADVEQDHAEARDPVAEDAPVDAQPRDAKDPGADRRRPSCAESRPFGPHGRRGLQVRLTIPLATWLGLADDPAVLDGYGPLPAAIARQIAAEAARDRPTTTTWRCVVVHDRHATVLGVGDVIPTPRHDPTGRQKAFTRTAETFCTYPGCRVQSWRCDIDHCRPYDHDDPSAGGPTCTCNLHPLCRRHHRLKTAGLIRPRLVPTGASSDGRSTPAEEPRPTVLGDIPGDAPPGSLEWTTLTGRRYPHRPPRATPAPTDRDVLAALASHDHDPVDRSRNDEHLSGTARDCRSLGSDDPALAHWDRARLRRLEQQAEREARRARRGAVDLTSWQAEDLDAPPPF